MVLVDSLKSQIRKLTQTLFFFFLIIDIPYRLVMTIFCYNLICTQSEHGWTLDESGTFEICNFDTICLLKWEPKHQVSPDFMLERIGPPFFLIVEITLMSMFVLVLGNWLSGRAQLVELYQNTSPALTDSEIELYPLDSFISCVFYNISSINL